MPVRLSAMNRHPKSALVVGLSAVAIVLGLLWWRFAGTGGPAGSESESLSPALSTPAPDDARTTEPPLRQASARRETEITDHQPESTTQEPPPKVSKGQYLRDYWGDMWPQYERQIIETGGDLETLIDPSRIARWEEVEPHIRDKVLGGSVQDIERLYLDRAELDDMHLREMFEGERRFNDDILLEMRDICSRFDSEVLNAARHLAREERRYRERIWDNKLLAVGPVFWVGGPDKYRSGTITGMAVSSSHSYGGWSAFYCLSAEDDPFWGAAYQNYLDALRRRETELRTVR